MLLDHGAEVNHQGRGGYTALMRASEYPSPKNVNLLLNHGAKVYLKNKDNETALMLATRVSEKIQKSYSCCWIMAPRLIYRILMVLQP